MQPLGELRLRLDAPTDGSTLFRDFSKIALARRRDQHVGTRCALTELNIRAKIAVARAKLTVASELLAKQSA